MTEIFNKRSETEKRKLLRAQMPPAEVLLWQRLKGRQIEGLKFRRQYGIGPFVVDFYCPELHLAIEIDGPSHGEAAAVAYDAARQEYIAALGIGFLRFANAQIYCDIEGVVVAIAAKAGELRSAAARV